MKLSPRQQRTIASTVSLSGFGYWSGRDVTVEFRPAPQDTGIVFVRGDLDPPRTIPATVEHRIEIPRRTVLSAQGVTVEMVEHVMAALVGLQVDNCEVWVDQAEMPGCDGSSREFVETLQSAGFVKQAAARRTLVVTEPLRVGDQQAWVEARPATTYASLSLHCRLDYGPGPIGRQTISLALDRTTFCRELASARTFILQEEAAWLRQRGLGQRVTCHDLLVFDEQGPIDNPLRFPDECVRHKALDLVGDLALSGCDLVGHFVASRSGHRLNAEMAAALLQKCPALSDRRKSA